MTDDREIRTIRRINAPRARVFAAFSDPDTLASWWGPEGFTNEFEAFDFRVGGTWRFVMHAPDGQAISNDCRFLEIDVPGRIVLHHLGPQHEYWATFEFEKDDAHTVLTWTMLHASAEECERLRPFIEPANEQNLDRLERALIGASR